MPEQTANPPVKKFRPQTIAAWMPVITAVLAVAYAIAFYFLLILPKIGPLMTGGKYDVSPLKERAKSEQDYIDKMDKTVSAFKSVEAAQTAKVETAVPAAADIPSLVETVYTLAKRHNMSLGSIDILADEKATGRFGRGSIRLSAALSNGSYTQFRALLPDIERSLLLLDLEALSFVGESQFTFRMRSYFVDLNAK